MLMAKDQDMPRNLAKSVAVKKLTRAQIEKMYTFFYPFSNLGFIALPFGLYLSL